VEFCLVRHGIATERGHANYRDDALRPLTPEGREKMEAAAVGLARLFLPQLVMTSPLVRARQTADIVVVASGGPKLQTHDGLATGDHESVIAAATRSGAERVTLVGHEPLLSEMLSWLLTGSEGRLRSGFKKGGAALVAFDGAPHAGVGELRWAVPPGALRRMS
jgi:phosphohistidine phosphatase